MDNILVDRKHIYCNRDAEANDMVDMGSDHRSVMGHSVITAPKKEVSQKTHCDKTKMKTAENTTSQSDDKTRSGEAIKFEERYAELERKIKHKAEIASTAAAALVLDEDASTTTAATCALSKDPNAAAAIEKAKRRDVMSKSQNNKNEKINGGDDEIRKLIEKRRNTAKGDRHQLR